MKQNVFNDMPIKKAVLSLALPTIMGQIILVIYNMADTFYIGLTNSDIFMTAVTICLPVFMLLSAIANLFGVGGASLIARCLGVQNEEKAKDASSFSVVFCLITTVVYSLLVLLFRDVLVNLLGGNNTEVHYYASIYLMITVVIGGLSTSMNMLLAHLIRAEGKTLDASIGVVIGGLLNIVLDPLFMFYVLAKGNEVKGAAIATALSNLIACLYFVFIIVFKYKKKTYIRLRMRKSIVEDNIPKDVIAVGIPACVMTTFENISYGVLDGLMSINGVAYQAGLGVAKKINMLAHSCVRGLTQGSLPLLSYNYSAKNNKRLKEATNYTLLLAIGMASICMLACLIFAEPLVEIFVHTESLTEKAAMSFLRILCVGAPFSACAYTFISFFQAIGEGKISFRLAILRKGLVDIPLMFIMANIIKIYGCVLATPITDILCCIVAITMFRKLIDFLDYRN